MNFPLSVKIKELRKAHDLTLSELARRAGISKAYLFQLESGKSKNPSAIKLYDIAKELGVTIEYLINKPYLKNPYTVRKVGKGVVYIGSAIDE